MKSHSKNAPNQIPETSLVDAVIGGITGKALLDRPRAQDLKTSTSSMRT
jgi:hypothetical protein